MSALFRHLTVASALIWPLTACDPGALDSLNEPCLSLRQPDGSALSVSQPARVSLLFSVDTCGGQPVSRLESTAFSIAEDGKPLSDLEGQRRIRPRGEQYRLTSLLLLDFSGSVLRSGQYPDLKAAALRYLEKVLAEGAGHEVAVMTFDGRAEPSLVVPFTNDIARARTALDTLDRRECSTNGDCRGVAGAQSCAGWRCVDDSTNLYGAVVSALDTLQAKDGANQSVRYRESALVLFTDGSDQAARVPVDAALAKVKTSTANVFTVALGAEVDQTVLRALGSAGSFTASGASGLSSAFESVANRVAARANRFYVLDYCSPKRSGQHLVKVTASLARPDGQTWRGSLTQTFDATGFSSGCSLTE